MDMTREKETIRQSTCLRVKTMLEVKDQDLLVFKRQAATFDKEEELKKEKKELRCD